MKAPGTAYDDDVLGRDPQPAHMRDYVETTEDNGGVHINSGIPNKAFHLVATALGGYSALAAAVEDGLPRTISARMADDFLWAVGRFMDLVDQRLGVLGPAA